MVVTLSHDGYAKSQPVTEYQAPAPRRARQGATDVKDEDFIDKLFVANTHDTLLCFSNRGKVYWLKVYQLPQAGRGARGKPIVNLLPLEEGERINAMLPIREFAEDRFVFMATSQGTVKKTPLEAFSRPRAAGIIAVDLEEGDRLVGVDDHRRQQRDHAVHHRAARRSASPRTRCGRWAARPPACAASRVGDGHEVNSLIVVREGPILTASENGYGKLTPVERVPAARSRRAGRDRAAALGAQRPRWSARCRCCRPTTCMLISQGGTLVRTPVAQVSVLGRNTQGVRLMRIDDEDRLVGLARVQHFNGEDEEPAEGPGETTPGAEGATPAEDAPEGTGATPETLPDA